MLPPEFIRPNYSNGSIANVPATIAKWLAVPFDGLPPLQEELWRSVADNVQHVVVFLIDALGWNILNQIGETLPAWDTAAIRSPITSVFPSTTVNALSSIHTGTPPAQHGLVGLNLLFPTYGTIGQMIALTPTFQSYPTALEQAGLDTGNFLATRSVGAKFAEQGVRTHIYKERQIIDTGLSKILGSQAMREHGVISIADMFVRVRALLEKRQSQKLYVHCYWDTVDLLSHFRGPLSEHVFAEVQTLFYQLKRLLLDQLPKDGKTVVALMSDHGHVFRPKSHNIYLRDHPKLREKLLMRHAGDEAAAYLYVKHGQIQATIDYINGELGERAFALRSADALEMGLFGSPPYAPHTRERIGDVLALMRNGAMFVAVGEEEKRGQLRGAHGGLESAEMQASWLVWRP